jgi:hypothetical protein
MSEGRYAGKTWKAFTQCLQWAQQGKTFIFVHKNFVAIDMETWNRLKREKLPTMTFYDEVGEITEEQWAELDKIIPKRDSHESN